MFTRLRVVAKELSLYNNFANPAAGFKPMPKTFNKLYFEICSFKNLINAFYKARRGKRNREAVADFEYHLEKFICELKSELENRTYGPGAYTNFYVFEHKKRLITAAPFRDRVVHHAIVNVLEPIFERMFIYDSYACRKEKGQHKAVRRFTEFCRSNRYVLRCDIKKFYPSVDHQILLRIISRWIKDRDVICLVRKILESGKSILESEYIPAWYQGDGLFTPFSRSRGIPIGNLTSQFFGNVYLNELDHYIKEILRAGCYLRYMDDFAVFSDKKSYLWDVKKNIRNFLEGLRLSLNPAKENVFPVNTGVEFLGFRIFPTHRLVRKSTVYKFTRHFKDLLKNYRMNLISIQRLRSSFMAWIGHIKHANYKNLCKTVLNKFRTK